MSTFERAVCQSARWRAWTSRVVLPWALQGTWPRGRTLKIGGGSGAMAEQILDEIPEANLTVTDFDEAMVRVGRERLRRFGDRAVVRQADATALPFDDLLSVRFLLVKSSWQSPLA